MLEFQKISIKMKNCKSFYEAQTASCLKETIHPSPNPQPIPHQIKSYYAFGKKKFMEIYRNIQTFAFKVLQKCSSLASRNGAAQMYFQKETYLLENMLSEKCF